MRDGQIVNLTYKTVDVWGEDRVAVARDCILDGGKAERICGLGGEKAERVCSLDAIEFIRWLRS